MIIPFENEEFFDLAKYPRSLKKKLKIILRDSRWYHRDEPDERHLRENSRKMKLLFA